MGTRRIDKEELSAEHYKTTLCINKVRICSNCPLKLYSKKNDNIVLCIGNIVTDTMLVLPSYDTNAKIGYNTILNITQNVYKDIKGTELLEDCYVTRSIKCVNKTDFNLEKDAIKSCFTNLLYEISRITPRKIIIFDKLLADFDLDNYFGNKIVIKTVISPGVMYYDNQHLKDVFVQQLTESL